MSDKIKMLFFNLKPTGCTFYRQLLPYCYLQMRDKVEIEVAGPRFTRKEVDGQPGKFAFYEIAPTPEDLKKVEWCDILFLGREWLEQGFIYLLKAKELKKKIIYELDDNLFIIPLSNPASNLYNKVFVQSQVKKFLPAADFLSVSLNSLKDYYSQYNPNIYVLPNLVHPPFFGMVSSKLISDKIKIGWAGSITHYEDLKEFNQVIEQLNSQFNNLQFIFFGYMPDDFKRFPNVTYIKGNPDIFQYFRSYADLQLDIVLAPMSEINFNKYKSNLRILESWVIGAPVVASKIYEYESTINNGVNGLLCKRFLHWMGNLQKLINDPNLRRDLSNNGKEALKNYMLENKAQMFFDALNKVLGRDLEKLEPFELNNTAFENLIRNTWNKSLQNQMPQF